jgi:hypothetical protein
MAMITCPDCEKPISSMASQCINCGRPINLSISETNESTSSSTQVEPSTQDYALRTGTLISVHPKTGDGCLKDTVSGSFVQFNAKDVEGGKFLRGYINSKIEYRSSINGNILVSAPADAPINTDLQRINRLATTAPNTNSDDSTRKDREKIEATSSDKASNFVIRILGAIAVAWLIFTEDGQSIIKSIFKGAAVETDITKYDCSKVADLIKGTELQNAFGVKSKILKLENLKQTSKTAEKIVCEALTTTSRGKNLMEIYVEKAGNNEIIYSAQSK